ncbi:MAG: hypothetical protein E7488_08120 [Ruminococcaceae bacterium]|nr:hypothetical protein [Oscillospiraceae bacterium]
MYKQQIEVCKNEIRKCDQWINALNAAKTTIKDNMDIDDEYWRFGEVGNIVSSYRQAIFSGSWIGKNQDQLDKLLSDTYTKFNEYAEGIFLVQQNISKRISEFEDVKNELIVHCAGLIQQQDSWEKEQQSKTAEAYAARTTY